MFSSIDIAAKWEGVPNALQGKSELTEMGSAQDEGEQMQLANTGMYTWDQMGTKSNSSTLSTLIIFNLNHSKSF